MTKCADCNQTKSCVTLRQSDLRLCNECQQTREIDPPKPGDPPRHLKMNSKQKSTSSEINSVKVKSSNHSESASKEPENGLANYVQSLKNRGASVSSAKCNGPICQTKNGETCCTCFICQKDFHLNCVGLSRRPPKSSNWCCNTCSNVPAIIRQLQSEIQTLQRDRCQLNEKVKALETQVMSLQDNINKQDIDQDLNESVVEDVSAPTRTALFIGDSMLRNVRHDNFEDAQIKSISGAKITDIVNELNKRDDIPSFRNIIIHCGTNDVSSGADTKDIVDTMEAAVTSIMIASSGTSVVISAVCPRDDPELMPQIDSLNDELRELAGRLGCSFIDTGLFMTYRNGDVDSSLFVDGLHFNDRGNETFIRAIAKGVPNLVINDSPWTRVNGTRQSQRRSRDQAAFTEDRRDTRSSRQNQRRRTNQRYNPRISHSQNRNSHRNHNSHSHNSYTGCYNCGLKNHNQNTCRHKHRVKCNNCYQLGHKANYCNVQNNQNDNERPQHYKF